MMRFQKNLTILISWKTQEKNYSKLSLDIMMGQKSIKIKIKNWLQLFYSMEEKKKY